MSVINRSAVIIRPLPPYLAWAKQDDTTNIAERVFEDLRTAPHVYLLPEYEDAESEREVLEDFWPELFAAMLNGWLTDEQQWPKNRTHQMFSGSTSRCVRWSRICIWMKRWSNSTRAGHAAIPDSRRPDIRIGRAPEVILCAVRWYLRYSLSLRDVEELLDERGLKADHTTVWRWVQRYGPELEQRLRRHLKPTNKSWRVDETYVRVKGRWCYVYRAIDSTGATIDFLLSALRDAAAAKRLFRQALSDPSHPQPRVINTDQARLYGAAIPAVKEEGTLRGRCRHRPGQYVNNILEQDHRAIKRRVQAKQGFRERAIGRPAGRWFRRASRRRRRQPWHATEARRWITSESSPCPQLAFDCADLGRLEWHLRLRRSR